MVDIVIGCFVVGISIGVVVVDSNRSVDGSNVVDSVIGGSVLTVVLGSGFKAKIFVFTFLHSGLVEPNVHNGPSTLFIVKLVGSFVVDAEGKNFAGTFVAVGFWHRTSYRKPGPHFNGTIT